MILVSRNSEPHNYVKEYTDTLQASQPSKVKAGLQVQSKEVLKSTGKKRGKHMEYEKVRKFTGVKLDLAIFRTQKYRITGQRPRPLEWRDSHFGAAAQEHLARGAARLYHPQHPG